MDKISYSESNEWDKYVKEIGCPFSYTRRWIDFQCEYSGNKYVTNESYILCQDNMPIAVVKIIIEKDKEYYIGWKNGFLEEPYVSPLLPYNRIEKIQKAILHDIDTIASEYGCSYVLLKQDVLCNPRMEYFHLNYNWLIKDGYIDYSSNSQLIDLKMDIECIRAQFRKGTKSELKKGNCLQIEILDYSSVKEDDIIECRSIYEYDAGGKTRASELLYLYYDMIRDGMAILGFASLNGIRIATIICSYYNERGYYLLYAEKTDCADNTSPGYTLQYEMIQKLKELGVEYYEMGEQVFGPSLYGSPEKKEIDISLFKRGFGGYTLPMFRGRKSLD